MNKLLKQTDRRFDATLDFLEKKYFNLGVESEKPTKKAAIPSFCHYSQEKIRDLINKESI